LCAPHSSRAERSENASKLVEPINTDLRRPERHSSAVDLVEHPIRQLSAKVRPFVRVDARQILAATKRRDLQCLPGQRMPAIGDRCRAKMVCRMSVVGRASSEKHKRHPRKDWRHWPLPEPSGPMVPFGNPRVASPKIPKPRSQSCRPNRTQQFRYPGRRHCRANAQRHAADYQLNHAARRRGLNRHLSKGRDSLSHLPQSTCARRLPAPGKYLLRSKGGPGAQEQLTLIRIFEELSAALAMRVATTLYGAMPGNGARRAGKRLPPLLCR
jgi:hypothetical protein